MTELALKLIAENKKTRATFLDLGNCGLTEVPDEIGELVWLEELSFGSEWWNWERKEWFKSKNQGEINNIAKLSTGFNCFKQSSGGLGQLKNLKKLWVRGKAGSGLTFGISSVNCKACPLSCAKKRGRPKVEAVD